MQKGYATHLSDENRTNLDLDDELNPDLDLGRLELTQNVEEEINIFVGLEPVRKWADPVSPKSSAARFSDLLQIQLFSRNFSGKNLTFWLLKK